MDKPTGSGAEIRAGELLKLLHGSAPDAKVVVVHGAVFREEVKGFTYSTDAEGNAVLVLFT